MTHLHLNRLSPSELTFLRFFSTLMRLAVRSMGARVRVLVSTW